MARPYTSAPTTSDFITRAAQSQAGQAQRERSNLSRGWLASIGGGALAAYGLRRRNRRSLTLILLGGGLVYQGISAIMQQRVPGSDRATEQTVCVERAITIQRSPQEVYEHWCRFEGLPTLIPQLKKVEILDATRSHWQAQAPAGIPVTWSAEVIEKRENEYLAWRSLPGSTIAHTGAISFMPAPGGRGTEVKVALTYTPPAGQVGDTLAKLFGRSPDQQIREGLRRLKARMEAGEIPTTSHQPRGRMSPLASLASCWTKVSGY